MRPKGRPRPSFVTPAPSGSSDPSFCEFNATALYCPRCGRAMPVEMRLLLVLPEGDEYAYHCAGCGEVLGKKTDRTAPPGHLLKM